MITVKSQKTGRVYEVRSQFFGRERSIHNLYYGGIFMASTAPKGLCMPGDSIETAIEKADKRSVELGIQVSD